MSKDEVAAAFEEIAALLEITGENAFKSNAYRTAARSVEQFEGDLKTAIADGSLSKVRGIGSSLLEKITTLVETGKLPYLEELRTKVPEGLLQVLRIPGLGPKKAKALFETLGVKDIESLKAACESDEVAKLKGFGAKTQAKILEGIAFRDTVGQRVRIDEALPLGLQLLEQVKGFPGVIRAEVCGSLRRRKETTGDIDICAASANPGPVLDAFVKLPEVMQVVGHGDTKASIVATLFLDGHKVVMNADLRVVSDEQFPFAIAYFTGSKEHNIRMRQRAIDRGLSLNEYGLHGKSGDVPAKEEVDIYRALDLHYVPPEMREDTGEIEAAEKAELPRLIEPGDIRGVFHNHTVASDGTATLEQMALAAKDMGWEYFGVGDHSRSLTIARGLSSEAVKKQWKEIEKLNAKLKGVQILKGTECDILEDGRMDYDDDLLAGFDYVVASVHTHFNLSEGEQTTRICRALSHPSVTMLGHATGRLLLRRPGYKVNLDAVLKAAADHGKMIEINANPYRLDLDWIYVKRAKAMGIPLVINPDAHATSELGYVPFGVSVARRGWLTKEDVFNTRSLKDVRKELERRKASGVE